MSNLCLFTCGDDTCYFQLKPFYVIFQYQNDTEIFVVCLGGLPFMEQVGYMWAYVNFEAFEWSLYDLEYEAKAIFSHSMCTIKLSVFQIRLSTL